MIDKGNYYQWYEKGHYESETRAWKENQVSGTLTTTDKTKIAMGGGMNNLRIRKLTPKECFRLMGVLDEDFEKVKEHQSDASLYHLAGDSIVTTCLIGMFCQLLGVDHKQVIEKLTEDLSENKTLT